MNVSALRPIKRLKNFYAAAFGGKTTAVQSQVILTQPSTQIRVPYCSENGREAEW